MPGQICDVTYLLLMLKTETQKEYHDFLNYAFIIQSFAF